MKPWCKSGQGSPVKIPSGLGIKSKSELQLTVMSFSDHLELSSALQNSSPSKKTPKHMELMQIDGPIHENSREDIMSQGSKNQTYENLNFFPFQLDDDSISSLEPQPEHRQKVFPQENNKIGDLRIPVDVRSSSLSLTPDSVFFEEAQKIDMDQIFDSELGQISGTRSKTTKAVEHRPSGS